MGWFQRLLGINSEVAKRQAPQAAPPVRAAQASRKANGRANAPDVFPFKENLTTTGVGGRGGKHLARPGTAVVEIVNHDGRLMALDVFGVDKPAPRGAFWPLPNLPGTYFVHGLTGLDQQEFAFPLGGPHPLKLPDHLLEKQKIGAVVAKIWWSCQ